MHHPTRLKVLIGTLVLISIYAVSLFALAAVTYVTPGTVQDPAGAPGSYTVAPVSIGETIGNSPVPTGALYVDGNGLLATDAGFTHIPVLVDQPNQTVANLAISSIANTVDSTTGVTNVGFEGGLVINDNFDHSGNGGSLIGTVNGAFLSSAATINKLIGNLSISGGYIGGTGTITDAIGVASNIINVGSTVTNGYLFYGQSIGSTNKYGVYIDLDDTINVLRELQLRQDSPLKWYDGDSSNYVAFKAPNVVASDLTWVLPSVEGTDGQVLTWHTGGLSWDTPAGGGGGGGETVTTVKLSLSQSDILALGTKVEVVPAPGPGKAIQILNIVGTVNFGTTAYDTNTQMVGFEGTDPSNGIFSSINHLNATSSKTILFNANGFGGPSSYKAVVENSPFYIQAGSSGPGGFTGGNPANGDSTIDLYVTYTTINL